MCLVVIFPRYRTLLCFHEHEIMRVRNVSSDRIAGKHEEIAECDMQIGISGVGVVVWATVEKATWWSIFLLHHHLNLVTIRPLLFAEIEHRVKSYAKTYLLILWIRFQSDKKVPLLLFYDRNIYIYFQKLKINKNKNFFSTFLAPSFSESRKRIEKAFSIIIA